MFFSRKPTYEVKLEKGETVTHVLTALAMASYEATEPFFEDGLMPDSVRVTAMLNPDEAVQYVKGDELMMCLVRGKFCMTHIRRVHRALSQVEKDGVVTFEVLGYEGDLDRLFDRADTMLRWIADDADATPVATANDAERPLFDLDEEIEIDVEAFAAEAPLQSVPSPKQVSSRPVAA